MGKFSQIKQFEEEKVQELKELEDSLQHSFQSLERDYQLKIKSVLEELGPYRQKVRDQFIKSLQAESNDVSRVMDAQMEKLLSSKKSIDDYAREIAKIIIE